MSQSKIYVGNLAYGATIDDLNEYFGQFGEITDSRLITDRETGRSKGFGFITYATGEAAEAAIQGANGEDLKGRQMRVNLAREDDRRSGGGRPGGRSGGW